MSCFLCGQQAELCAQCSNQEVEVVRDSCVALDEFNALARDTIEDIFEQMAKLQNSKQEEDKTKGNDSKNSTSNNREILSTLSSKFGYQLPHISKSSVMLLLQQLFRLEVVNLKLKNYQISRTKDSMERKIHKTQSYIESLSRKIKEEEAKVTELNEKIKLHDQEALQDLQEKQAQEILKLARVCRQAKKFQLNSYKVLIEASFNTHGRYLLKKLYFCRQPIINVEEFLSYNGKLEQLNQFLENVIIYQMKLSRIFDGSIVKMPYIEELKRLLPDLKFYEVVRTKGIETFGKELVDPSQEIDKIVDNNDQTPSKDYNNDSYQTINLGDALKLPLSLKTINYQRRRSTVKGFESASPDFRNSAESKRNSINNDTNKRDKMVTNSTIDKIATINNDANVGKDGILKKKMVILPHKILTKPLTKLTPKECVKFLQIIIKIYINFKVFFAYTKPLSEVYDFYKILQHSASLESFFESRLEQVLCSPSLVNSLQQGEAMDFLVLKTGFTPKPSVMNLYSRFFSSGATETNQANKKEKKKNGIFGDVSELGLSVERQLGDKDEMRVTLQKVYQLMIRDNSNHSDKLENWDVISKMI